MSTPDDDVLVAAEELAEELHTAQQESTESAFDSLLIQCNEIITEAIGVDYGSVSETSDYC